MRTSRRNKGLVPEFEPEPTPPNSQEMEFTDDFQIETTIEETERRNKEDEEDLSKEIGKDSEEEEHQSEDEMRNKKKDIVLSSSDSDGTLSGMTDKIVDKEALKSKYLIEQAKEALADGDEKLLALILNSMGGKQDVKEKQENQNNEVNPLKNYKKGSTSRSGLRAFTEFWDNHLKKLDYHLPLTIFNEEWIELDSTVAGSNTSKKKDKISGQIPRSEWYLSFAEWTRARQLMVKYLDKHYRHEDFARDLKEHFEYVQKLSVRHGWVAAFRYDIAVRTDVLCNHVNGAPGDPSVVREEFLEDALARTNLLRDGRIEKYDNPYAKGHERERYSPIT
ncbi:hypothetical protein DFH28DRAFT_1125558 [Melampsora americana]|nr:hypothetical protein DFH28DRAFT_1125558 [Melampsora americana]